MAHYALLDNNDIVTDVIVGRDENDVEEGISSWEQHYSTRHGQTCLRTSYNTSCNQHPNGTPFRGNYAGIGYTYDSARDAFIPPKPDNATGFDENTLTWLIPHVEVES